MKRKGTTALLLGIMMIFSLAACGSKTDSGWAYSKEDFTSFREAFSEKALDQDDSGIDIIYVQDVELDDKISVDDVLVFNYDELDEEPDYEYISYDLIQKHQIKTERVETDPDEPGRLLVYFYGGDDFFTNYGVLISKDVSKDRKYILTKTHKEYLGADEEYDGFTVLTFAPLFSYLDSHGISMEKIIEDGVISEATAEDLANNENTRLSNIASLCSYLGCNVEDIMKYDDSESVHEAAGAITWDPRTVKKQDYESTGMISFAPFHDYIASHDEISMQQLIREEVLTSSEVTRLNANMNFKVGEVVKLCHYLKTEVSDVITFVEY